MKVKRLNEGVWPERETCEWLWDHCVLAWMLAGYLTVPEDSGNRRETATETLPRLCDLVGDSMNWVCSLSVFIGRNYCKITDPKCLYT